MVDPVLRCPQAQLRPSASERRPKVSDFHIQNAAWTITDPRSYMKNLLYISARPAATLKHANSL